MASRAAAAIGVSEETGSLEPGKWGDLIVIDGGDFPPGALLDRVLQTKRQEVQATVVGGREVFRRPARVP